MAPTSNPLEVKWSTSRAARYARTRSTFTSHSGWPASVDGDALTATEPVFPKHSPAKKSKAITENSAGEKEATRTQPDAEVVDKVIKHLRAHSKSRPANRAALERHLPHLVGGSPTMATVHAVVAELERRGVVTAEAEQIRYKIPNAKE